MLAATPAYSPDEATATGLMVILPIMLVLYVIPSIIVTWKLYTKAGKPGWAAIIPVYTNMVMAEIGQKPVGLGVAAGVLGLISNIKFPGSSILALISLVLVIVLVVAMARQYNRGVGFWISYVLLPVITLFLVKDTKYIGAQGSAPVATPETPATPPSQ